MPTFSVIIPVYNREQLLVSCIESVLRQTCTDYEIIAVDDGSTDGSVAALGKFGDRVRIFTQQNAGPGAARNLGLQHATGEYIAFLDSDDLWLPWTLSTYEEIIRQPHQTSLIRARSVDFKEERELEDINHEELKTTRFDRFITGARLGEYVGTCVMLVRRDVTLKAGGLTNSNINAEDHDLTLRICDAPGYVSVRSPVLVGMRQHGGNVSGDMTKTYLGMRYLFDRERAGDYAGGKAIRSNRRSMIAMRARGCILQLAQGGRVMDAARLYFLAFPWNLANRRFRFLLAAPWILLRCAIRRPS